MKISHLYQSFILILFLSVLNTQNIHSQTSLFSYEQFVDEDGDTLKYRKLISDYDTVSKYPLVIFLHGSGERGDDNESQLKWGVQKLATDQIMKIHKPIIIAPQCPQKMRWGNYDSKDLSLLAQPTSPMESLLELIDQMISTMPIDTNRIYITGLSMGGFGTFDILSRRPDLFAAAVPVCGGGDPASVKSFAHVPLWIAHGALDDVVPPEFALKMYKALIKAGAKPGFTIYPDTGHFSWLAAYSDEHIIDWLFKQSK